MEYKRIQRLEDPLFKQMHDLMSAIFPPEEVLAFELWREPLEDPNIYVYVAVHDGEVVGATEYRYYESFNVAMTDFTIIGKPGLGIGRFLYKNRERHLFSLAEAAGKRLAGGFAEIYNPYRVAHHDFGNIGPMNPYVRREVPSHLGYRRLDIDYVHPSWDLEGRAVEGLDLCYLSYDKSVEELDASLVVSFLETYYAVLPNKPKEWHDMIAQLRARTSIPPASAVTGSVDVGGRGRGK